SASRSRTAQLIAAQLFFFFQAEDGIRDKLVTGVQTCALPISQGSVVTGCHPGQAPPDLVRGSASRDPSIPVFRGSRLSPGSRPRSEERRVGKEGRAWWWAWDERRTGPDVEGARRVGSVAL